MCETTSDKRQNGTVTQQQGRSWSTNSAACTLYHSSTRSPNHIKTRGNCIHFLVGPICCCQLQQLPSLYNIEYFVFMVFLKIQTEMKILTFLSFFQQHCYCIPTPFFSNLYLYNFLF